MENRFNILNDVDVIAAMIAKAQKVSIPAGTSVINPVNIYKDGSPPVGAGFVNPMTTLGDIMYANETDTPSDASRLGIGTAGQVLTVAGGIPSWADAASISKVAATTVDTNAYVVIDCGAIADTAIDHVCWVVVETLDGCYHAENRPRAAELGGVSFLWYKESGNLKVRVFNDAGSIKTVRVFYS